MKILVVSNLFPPDYDGGFEMNAFKLANALRKRGHDVEAVTSVFREEFKGDRSEPEWVHRIFKMATARDAWSTAGSFLEGRDDAYEYSFGRLIKEAPLRLKNILSLRETLRIAPSNERAMERFLASQKFDLAYVFGLHLVGASVLRPLVSAGVPVVYHYGDEWLAAYARPQKLKRLILTALHPITYPRECSMNLDHVLVVSEFLREKFLARGFNPATTHAVPRGIEFPLMKDVERPRIQPPTFFLASRLAYYKGTHIALKAAVRLHREDPERPWQMHIAGDGEEEVLATFHQIAKEGGIEHRVNFLGKITREKTIETMRQACAFISASIYGEPFANTIIEALACGTPLIGSRAGSMEEVVTDGLNGYLYDKSDDEALAKCMKVVLDHPVRSLEIALKGVERVEEAYTMERVLDQTEAYFERAVAPK